MAEHREAMEEMQANLDERTENAKRVAPSLGKKVSRRMSQFRHAASVAKTDKYLREIEELQQNLDQHKPPLLIFISRQRRVK